MAYVIFGIIIFISAGFVSIGIYLKKSFADPVGDTIQYDSNLKIYIGGGCNSIVLTSDDGSKALIVDTKYFKGAGKLREEINAPDITIVNTHFHMDHARGNKLYPDAYVISGICSWKHWDFDTAHSKRPDKALNPGEETGLKIGNENVRIMNMGSSHTSTDCVVYLENRKVLITGDIVWGRIHPMVLDPDCSISFWLKTLDKLEAAFDIKTIIPGHGNISDKSALIEMREYFLSIREAINNPEKLKLMRKKYQDFKTVPVTNSFEKIVKKIKKEINATGKIGGFTNP